MKRLGLADARPGTPRAQVKALDEDESDEHYFARVDAEIEAVKRAYLADGLTLDELAQIAAHNLVHCRER